MTADKILSSVIDSAVSKVSVAKFNKSVKAQSANDAVSHAVNETAQKIGDEILAMYNRVITTKLGDGAVQRTTLGLNEIKFETVQKAGTAQEYISKYKRTTHRGTYEVEADSRGLTTFTRYTSPSGKVLERTYLGGKVFRGYSYKNLADKEEKHLVSKGKVIKSVKHKCDKFKSKYLDVDKFFENGNSETLTYDSKKKLVLRTINFSDGTSLVKDVENGIVRYLNGGKTKKGIQTAPIAYHQNLSTGAVTAIKSEKLSEADAVRISYEFPTNGIKDAEFIYSTDRKFIRGKFTAKNIGNIECFPDKIFRNGKELSKLDLNDNSCNFRYYDNEACFELLLKDSLEAEGICRYLMPNLLCW